VPKLVSRICLSYVISTCVDTSTPSILAQAVTLPPCIRDVSSLDLNLDSDQICQLWFFVVPLSPSKQMSRRRHKLARSHFHPHIHQFIILKSALNGLNYVHCQFSGFRSDVGEVSVCRGYGAMSLENYFPTFRDQSRNVGK
jgi:hypothetical protein